jgi:hypothetical protein
MRSDNRALALIVGVFVTLFILIAVVACNTSGSGTYQYPQDHSHGYYDVHHHYHYYPKYSKGTKYYVVPSKPKSKGFGGFSKCKSFSGGSKRR